MGGRVSVEAGDHLKDVGCSQRNCVRWRGWIEDARRPGGRCVGGMVGEEEREASGCGMGFMSVGVKLPRE